MLDATVTSGFWLSTLISRLSCGNATIAQSRKHKMNVNESFIIAIIGLCWLVKIVFFMELTERYGWVLFQAIYFLS
jgi:hypothetical protein